jgi:hypothetical protein
MKKQFNHKSLGGFDVLRTYRDANRVLITERHRIMVTVDAQALASMLGPKAISNKSKQTTLCGGAIQLVDLGGVVQS